MRRFNEDYPALAKVVRETAKLFVILLAIDLHIFVVVCFPNPYVPPISWAVVVLIYFCYLLKKEK